MAFTVNDNRGGDRDFATSVAKLRTTVVTNVAVLGSEALVLVVAEKFPTNDPK